MRQLTQSDITQIVQGSAPVAPRPDLPIHLARMLTQGGDEAFICHWTRIYRLRIGETGLLELLP